MIRSLGIVTEIAVVKQLLRFIVRHRFWWSHDVK